MIYSSENCTFDAKVFRKKLQGKNNTITVVKTKSHVFGGYASTGWDFEAKNLREQEFRKDPYAFLFSLNKSHGPIKFECADPTIAIMCSSSHLIFGHYDLAVIANEGKMNLGRSKINAYIYRVPYSVNNQTGRYLNETTDFDIIQMEVYQIIL